MATVLVIDDNRDICKVLVRFLSSIGHRGEFATSGAAAFEYMRRAALPNLILLDIMMPDMDGIEVLRAIRESPATKSIPVIMFTAAADQSSQDRALKLGANEYWIKGNIDLIEMEASLSRYLSNAA